MLAVYANNLITILPKWPAHNTTVVDDTAVLSCVHCISIFFLRFIYIMASNNNNHTSIISCNPRTTHSTSHISSIILWSILNLTKAQMHKKENMKKGKGQCNLRSSAHDCQRVFVSLCWVLCVCVWENTFFDPVLLSHSFII